MATGTGTDTLKDTLDAIQRSATQAAGALQRVLQPLQTGISALQIHVGQFVQKLSPVTVQRFTVAVDNLYASIGKSLVPVMTQATQVITAVGGVFNGLTAEGQKAVQALAAGTVGLVAFAAAVATVEAVATGGLAPLLTLVVGALTGVVAAGADLKPMLDAAAGSLTGLVNGIGAAVTALAPAVTPLLGVLGQLADLAGGVIATAAGIAGQLAPTVGLLVEGFAGLFKAAVLMQPTFVLLSAAAGFLGVVVEGLGGIAAEVAPLVAALSPVLSQVAAAVTSVVGALAGAGGGLLGVAVNFLLTPVKLLAAGLTAAAPYVVAFARVVADVAAWIARSVRQLLALVGLNVPDLTAGGPKGNPADPTGMAFRQASTGGQGDALRRARESAFGAGGAGAAEKPEVKTASGIKGLNDKADEIYNLLVTAPERFWEKFKALPPELAKALAEWLRKQSPFSGGGSGGGTGSGAGGGKVIPPWLSPGGAMGEAAARKLFERFGW